MTDIDIYIVIWLAEFGYVSSEDAKTGTMLFEKGRVNFLSFLSLSQNNALRRNKSAFPIPTTLISINPSPVKQIKDPQSKPPFNCWKKFKRNKVDNLNNQSRIHKHFSCLAHHRQNTFTAQLSLPKQYKYMTDFGVSTQIQRWHTKQPNPAHHLDPPKPNHTEQTTSEAAKLHDINNSIQERVCDCYSQHKKSNKHSQQYIPHHWIEENQQPQHKTVQF